MNEHEKQHRRNSMANRHRYLEATKHQVYSDEFYTPPDLVAKLGAFDLDPCAGPMSHARRNIRRPKCGLKARWSGRVWMNPPYLEIHDWLEKFQAHGNGVALLNARCETKWFQSLASGADALLFVKSRIMFKRPSGNEGHPPVGSVLIAYGPENAIALKQSGIPGLVLTHFQ